MDLNLQAFSATVVLGAYFSIGLLALVKVLFGVPRRLGKAPWSDLKESVGDRLSGVTVTALVLTLFFAVGILVEDLSNKYVDARSETWWNQRRVVAAEADLRVEALFGTVYWNEGVASLGREWAAQHLFDRFGGPLGPSIGEAVRSGRLHDLATRRDDVAEVASDSYYRAKNILYRERNYFEELGTIQQRIDFTRSLAILTFILLAAALVFLAVELIWPRLVGGCLAWLRGRTHGRPRSLTSCRRGLRPFERRRSRALARGAVAIALLLAVFLGARTAYAHEEREFNLRTYGYFASLMAPEAEIARSPHLPDVSGLAGLEPRRLLVVHDTKRDRDEPYKVSGPRVGLLDLDCAEGAPAYEYHSVDVRWGGMAAPNDLEGACALPGRPREALVVESGPDSDIPARLLHLRVTRETDRWTGAVERAFDLPTDLEGLSNVEGIACAPGADGETLVLLCDRSSGTVWSAPIPSDPRVPPRLDLTEVCTLDAPPGDWAEPSKVRICSDLYAAPDGTVWASAAEDPDVDTGPFRSVLYEAGEIVNGDFECEPGNDAVARLEGFKVEAIGPGVTKDHDLSVGTDDEDYGGAWRPISVPGQREDGASADAPGEGPQVSEADDGGS